MSITRFGNELSTKVEQPGSGKIQVSADGVVVMTRIWQVDNDRIWQEIPNVKFSDPVYPNLFCVDVTVDPGKAKHAIITATFQGYQTLPPVIYEFQNSRMDRPIALHPKFMDTGAGQMGEIAGTEAKYKSLDPINGAFIKFFDGTSGTVGGKTKDNKFRGIEAYIVGSATFRKTSFSTTPNFSQTGVGKLTPPEAGPWAATIPDAGNTAHSWLLVENSCSNLLKGASILWQIVRVWQYNSQGWMTEIYSA